VYSDRELTSRNWGNDKSPLKFPANSLKAAGT
jgi:hypothetical protein